MNIEKALAHNVEEGYDSKPAEYEIYSKGGSNHSTIIKPDRNCGENLHDLRDVNHGQVTTSLKTVYTSVHCDSRLLQVVTNLKAYFTFYISHLSSYFVFHISHLMAHIFHFKFQISYFIFHITFQISYSI